MRKVEGGLRPVGGIRAYPPACKPMAYKPTGWKRPRREGGMRKVERMTNGRCRRIQGVAGMNYACNLISDICNLSSVI